LKESISEDDPKKFFEIVKENFQKLITKETMYFYLVDELTGKPVGADGYPIEITKPSDFVPKMLPLIHFGMRAMSIYNGSAGICRMFGVPMPKIPKGVQDDMRDSVHILKQKSSVETFKAVHQKVEDDDGNRKSVRGECLRELEKFFKDKDPSNGFAGLRRISDLGGGAIWTTISDENEVRKWLDERARLREKEDRSDMSALQDQLLQRNKGAKEEVNKESQAKVKELQAKVKEFERAQAQPPAVQTKCSCTIS
jgi:hypothetical protein